MFMILDAEKIDINEELSEVNIECPLCSFVQIATKKEVEKQNIFSCPECKTLFVLKSKKTGGDS